MRYLVGFLCVCAVVGTLPLNASAQAGEADTTSEPNLQEPAPSSEPATEQPALQLKLDAAGVDVVPSPARTTDGYTLEEIYVRHAKRRIRRAGIGLGVSLAAFAGGIAMMGVAISESNVICILECPDSPAWVAPVGATGGVLTAGGFAGIIVSAIHLGGGRTELRRLKEAHYGTPRRVQWDLAGSRLVF
jgi:hypothetical protein